MSRRLPPLAGVELEPMDRFGWERIVYRIKMPKPLKLVALILAGHADKDGTRVRPGAELLAAFTGDGERHARRLVGQLRDQYGLIQQTSRGGGRGGAGRTATYRLTVPVDLLDRCDLLDPDGRPNGLTGHPEDRSNQQEPTDPPDTDAQSPDTEVPTQRDRATVDAPEPPAPPAVSPDTQVAGETPSPVDGSVDKQVDNLGTTLIDNDFHRTSEDTWPRLTGHLEPIDRTPRCPTTNQTTHLQRTNQQPSWSVTSATTGRAGQRFDQTSPPQPSRPKCPHGLSPGKSRDGTAHCPLCRRNATHHAAAPPAPALAAIA